MSSHSVPDYLTNGYLRARWCLTRAYHCRNSAPLPKFECNICSTQPHHLQPLRLERTVASKPVRANLRRCWAQTFHIYRCEGHRRFIQTSMGQRRVIDSCEVVSTLTITACALSHSWTSIPSLFMQTTVSDKEGRRRIDNEKQIESGRGECKCSDICRREWDLDTSRLIRNLSFIFHRADLWQLRPKRFNAQRNLLSIRESGTHYFTISIRLRFFSVWGSPCCPLARPSAPLTHGYFPRRPSSLCLGTRWSIGLSTWT